MAAEIAARRVDGRHKAGHDENWRRFENNSYRYESPIVEKIDLTKKYVRPY